jgi:hypothetical protein
MTCVPVWNARIAVFMEPKVKHVPPGTVFKNLLMSGAGEGIRTLDPDLGKVVLYH